MGEPNASVGTNDKHTMLSANAGSMGNNKKKKSTLNKKILNKHAKARNAIAEAVALTSSRAVAVENGSHSVLPGNANATDDEIDAIMKKQKDLPVGNTKEERKKRRLIRNRVSAQLHRERKKKYIASLEEKVRDQCQQISRMNTLIQNLGAENRRLMDMAAKNVCPSCASSGSDSSMPYSPMSESNEDDVDPTEDEKLEPGVLPQEEMGDFNEYADTLLENVEIGDADEFEFGMWGEDIINADLPSHPAPSGVNTKRKFAFLFGVFFMSALFGSSILNSPQDLPVLMLNTSTANSPAAPIRSSAPASKL